MLLRGREGNVLSKAAQHFEHVYEATMVLTILVGKGSNYGGVMSPDHAKAT